MARVRIDVNSAAVQHLLSSPAGEVPRAINRYTRRTANGARSRAPVDNGKLRASIGEDVTAVPGRIVGRVSTPLDYGLYQHEGTGIYGPTGQPIRPKKSGGVLVFKPKGRGPMRAGQRGGRGGLVFAKEVKGVPPNPYLVDALRDAVPWPVRRLLR